MRISVIIPSYNRAHTLPRAIKSVQSQTVKVDEIIIVDDGSNDATHKVLKAFPDVIVKNQVNQGVSSARNTGILAAKNDWIALLDSDDEWLPEKIERQAQLISTNPQNRLCHGNELWVRNGKHLNQKKIHRKQGGNIFNQCLPLCVISPSAALIRKDLLLECGLFDTDFPACEDYDLWLKICARESVLYVEEPILRKYGGHDDQLSHKYWGLDRFRIRALKNILESGTLSLEQTQSASTMLRKKALIFAKGARKHGRPDEANHYEGLAQEFHD